MTTKKTTVKKSSPSTKKTAGKKSTVTNIKKYTQTPLAQMMATHINNFIQGNRVKKIPRVKLDNGLKILYLDIETTPILAAVWSCHTQYVAPEQIITPSSILCYAAKWDNNKKVIFDSVGKNSLEDMMRGLHDLLDEADVVVHYNGKKFDIPKINRQFVLLGLGEPSKYEQVDMLTIVRGVGGFDSNKLMWVVQALEIGAKVKNSGLPLWLGCMSDVPKAWREMERYNRKDTTLLEDLYHLYLPWIRVHPSSSIHQISKGEILHGKTCTNCGSTDLIKKGIYKTKTQMYQRYKCKNCGTSLRDRTTCVPKSQRQFVLSRTA